MQAGDLGQVYYLYGLRTTGAGAPEENAVEFGPHTCRWAILLGEARCRGATGIVTSRGCQDCVLNMEFASGVLAHVQFVGHPHKSASHGRAPKECHFDDMEPRENCASR